MTRTVKIALASIVALGVIVFVVLVSLFQSAVQQAAINQANQSDEFCINYDVGQGVPVNGLGEVAAANATLLVQEALSRGLGKEGAAIAIMAGLTESGLNPGERGDNHSEPPANWSMGIFQTKLWFQAREAWEKPGGGYYPKNDPASIERAKALALDPQWQADWFMDRLSGEHSSTKSLKNYRWRTDKKYRDKPWLVAQKIEQSAFADGRNYRATWNGKTGYPTPMEIVETIVQSGIAVDPDQGTSDSATRFTSIDRPFPDLEVDANNAFVIPGPNNADLSPNGYPVLPNRPYWLATVTSQNAKDFTVAKWSRTIFEDLINRWNSDATLSRNYPIQGTGAEIRGYEPRKSGRPATDFNSGTAISINPRQLRANGGTGPLTESEVQSIEKIVRDMGGMIAWGGPANAFGAGYFYVPAGIGPDEKEGWATNATSLGSPPYFVIGDSIANGMTNLLERSFPDTTVDAVDGRKTASGISKLRKSNTAKNANTWIVMLGTNDGPNPAIFTEYVNQVMKLAGDKTVFWVNAYRPASNGLGVASANNEALREAKKQYPNLIVVDWASSAATNPQWFENDPMKLHPNGEGEEALLNLIKGRASGNGSTSLGGLSSLCGNGTGEFAQSEFVIGGDPTGVLTTNSEFLILKGDRAANRAKGFVGNPPSSCSNRNCVRNCGHLSARAWGMSNSGYATAKLQWEQTAREGGLMPAVDPKTGDKNSAAYNIPIGALLYWDTPCSGCSLDTDHVATYIGNGLVMSNYKGEYGDGVYAVPFEGFAGYGPYLGWGFPPRSWKATNYQLQPNTSYSYGGSTIPGQTDNATTKPDREVQYDDTLVPPVATYWMPSSDEDINNYIRKNLPQVIDEVGRHSGITWARTNNKETAHLIVEWGETDNATIESGANVLAAEKTIRMSESRRFVRSIITLNRTQLKRMYFTDYFPDSPRTHIRTLLRHEIGHTLGLPHVSDTNQVMTPIIGRYSGPDAYPPGDIANIKDLYEY